MASSLIRRGFRLCVCSSSLANSRGASRSPAVVSGFHVLTGHANFDSKPSRPAAFGTFSSKVGSDEKLRMVLTSEIQNASSQACDEVALPSGFPFQIVDNPGDESITLTRKYDGESIEVLVLYNVESDENMDEDDDDNDDGSGNEDKDVEANISLEVKIDKGQESLLEFHCTMNPNELHIDSMALKARNDSDGPDLYDGPPFSDLDENMQNEFYEYLKKRGIDSSIFEFLQEYMVKKDDREYLTWLTNMKNFVSE